MYLDLSGIWKIRLVTDYGLQEGDIRLPGVLQAQGYGNEITFDTQWISGLHDTFWWEREEYQYAQENGTKVPFLSQPPRHFIGKAYYQREIDINVETNDAWYLYIEITHWRTKVFVDGKEMGEDCSLCTAHKLSCGRLEKGKHVFTVEVDNAMQYPYRPDGHGISDALGATWNGMAGELALITEEELEARENAKKEYAKEHPRHMEIKDGKFYVDGKPEYFRGTHFGGDYPLTGYPTTTLAWWKEKLEIIKSWGLNFVRCHSYCPPEAGFQAADEIGIYLQPECGMWNHFEEGIPMIAILREETRRILEQFGHHPSFVLFSPTNEPSGYWYQVLRSWVEETREYDRLLGYENRRVYTAESGWYYEVPPAEITGTDYLYFHRSNFGPLFGGNIRNSVGWRGKTYSPSLEGANKPVICHELGQWCSYPDFRVIDRFQGYLQPGDFEIFRENCKANGLLSLNEQFAYASGRNQLRLYKEEIEANLRTPELYGFELLDLHDYLGQGTALVGLLDAFWQEKGYAKPEEFRKFCNETVLLAAFDGYVYTNKQKISIPISVCHFGRMKIDSAVVKWELKEEEKAREEAKEEAKEKSIMSGKLATRDIVNGQNTELDCVELDFTELKGNRIVTFRLWLDNVTQNEWTLYIYEEVMLEEDISEEDMTEEDISDEDMTEEDISDEDMTEDVMSKEDMLEEDMLEEDMSEEDMSEEVMLEEVMLEEDMSSVKEELVYTSEWLLAKEALEQGKRVIYSPYLTDLDYECPSLSIKNIFWNSQMGPNWDRSLGLLIQEESQLFCHFPTKKDGGWQWEDILESARGFCMQGLEQVEPLVRVIDDWNRNLPLALIWESQVGAGKLLVVSADLQGEFVERPAAHALRRAVLHYAAAEEFAPKSRIEFEAGEQHLFSVNRMQELTEDVHYDEMASVSEGMALVMANPNQAVCIEKEKFPVTITVRLMRPVLMNGFLYVPEQRDRDRNAYPKDYEIYLWDMETECWEMAQIKGNMQFRNISLSQKIFLEQPYLTKCMRLVIKSCYGSQERDEWEEKRDGYYVVHRRHKVRVRLAGLHVLCDEKVDSSNQHFWEKKQVSTSKEIEQ